ncbi:ash family protein [Salmonella enterica]|uniref:ash family protein n=1 Tax=Salmonella enterica TaxID=28901 RepID=UPI000941EF17|nr:ash family protein [Salmonella enterica]
MKTRQGRTLKNVDAFWRWRYGYFAAAKSAAGSLNPEINEAHNTRQRVFLCVAPAHIQIMVAQVGQPKGWPVSSLPVLRTPPGLPPL